MSLSSGVSPQRGNDVVVDSLLIGHLGVGPQIWLFAGLIPMIQPLTQGHTRFGGSRFRFADAGPQFFQLPDAFGFFLASTFFVLGRPLSS